MSILIQHDGIPADRRRGVIGRQDATVRARIADCPLHDLELVTVQVPWVKVRMIIVDNDLDDLVVLDDIRIDTAVHNRIRRVVAPDGQSAIERGHLLSNISRVVDDESTHDMSDDPWLSRKVTYREMPLILAEFVSMIIWWSTGSRSGSRSSGT